MPDNKNAITALSVFAAVPVADLDRSIGWYARLIGREPDSRPMDGLADYFLPAIAIQTTGRCSWCSTPSAPAVGW